MGVFPLDQMADVGFKAITCLKLCSREIIFEVFQIPTYVITVSKRYRQTNGWARIASRGNKMLNIVTIVGLATLVRLIPSSRSVRVSRL